jgi:hypothetical protein
VTQATTVTPATSNIKDDSNIMAAYNSRNASDSRNESNHRTANIVWTPSKAGMTTAAEIIGTSQRQQQKGYPQQRLLEIVETSQQQY